MVLSSISMIVGVGGYTSNPTSRDPIFPLSSSRDISIFRSNNSLYGQNSISILAADFVIDIFSLSLSFLEFPSPSLSTVRSKSIRTSDIPESHPSS